MEHGKAVIRVPSWLTEAAKLGVNYDTPVDLMHFTVELAKVSALNGGGPFAAILVDSTNYLVAYSCNLVVPNHDSTAHAEILCIRSAQEQFHTHNLSSVPRAPCSLYASCAPCIQCFGAIYWAGINTIYSCATKTDAESFGFDEGPITPELWTLAAKRKGIKHISEYERKPLALEPFELYLKHGGILY